MNLSVHAIPYRSGKYFAIRQVMAANGFVVANSLDRKRQISFARTHYSDFFCISHAISEWSHCICHSFVIDIASLEKELFESLRTHSRSLSHGRRRPSQRNPFHVVVPVSIMYRLDVVP